MPPQLQYPNVGDLIAGAGGDPWAVNHSLQVGQPMQISNLAKAFHGAGRSTGEADATFEQARRRFEAAWNHQNGDSPINDSAEVQRTARALGAQPEQLPKIGADLENIAAALAEAQKTGAGETGKLDAQLQQLDRIIFWRGTLAEGGIREYIQAHQEIVVSSPGAASSARSAPRTTRRASCRSSRNERPSSSSCSRISRGSPGPEAGSVDRNCAAAARHRDVHR